MTHTSTRPCDITDTQRKIQYRKERILHLQQETENNHDKIAILNHEIKELEAMLQ